MSCKARRVQPAILRAFLIPSELRPKRRLKPSDVSGPPLSPRFGRGKEAAVSRLPLTKKRRGRKRA
ncbi:hypothetical protein EYC79_01535 [Agrobacterium cavarae]|uniref:Uncharacterized protein n=1 Tax=Agrobacterium cavarae TaxID=2528239 RepID=A0ABY1YG93_9HYPH|nr:hypothetical protein EYC79_01535 [Agrobacterium cavarae]